MRNGDDNAENEPKPISMVAEKMEINRIRNDTQASANDSHARRGSHIPVELRVPESRKPVLDERDWKITPGAIGLLSRQHLLRVIL